MTKIKTTLCAGALLAIAAVTSAGRAEELKGKFRFSMHGDGFLVTDEIRSNSANVGLIKEGQTERFLVDPRNDRAQEQAGTIRDGLGYGIGFEYGLWKWKWGELMLDANWSRFGTEIADIEVSHRFEIYQWEDTNLDGTLERITPQTSSALLVRPTGRFRYGYTHVDAGDLSWDLPQIGGFVRFRPAKTFNPYLGLGVGYFLVDFERSQEIDIISANLAASTGAVPYLDQKTGLVFYKARNGFGPVEVSVEDKFEWHLVGGVELTVKKKWAFFIESRYIFSDGKARITTDGRVNFGLAVPSGEVVEGSEDACGVIGGCPVYVGPTTAPVEGPGGGLFTEGFVGGLFDIGSSLPDPDHPPRRKQGPPDGILDSTRMFIQGGEIKYGGYDFLFGLKFTF